MKLRLLMMAILLALLGACDSGSNNGSTPTLAGHYTGFAVSTGDAEVSASPPAVSGVIAPDGRAFFAVGSDNAFSGDFDETLDDEVPDTGTVSGFGLFFEIIYRLDECFEAIEVIVTEATSLTFEIVTGLFDGELNIDINADLSDGDNIDISLERNVSLSDLGASLGVLNATTWAKPGDDPFIVHLPAESNGVFLGAAGPEAECSLEGRFSVPDPNVNVYYITVDFDCGEGDTGRIRGVMYLNTDLDTMYLWLPSTNPDLGDARTLDFLELELVSAG